MAKKTIPVSDVRDWVNERLWVMRDQDLYGVTNGEDFRKGMMAVLEMVLQSAGNYKGFNEFTEAGSPSRGPQGGKDGEARPQYY